MRKIVAFLVGVKSRLKIAKNSKKLVKSDIEVHRGVIM
jgi:hypothetical protein